MEIQRFHRPARTMDSHQSEGEHLMRSAPILVLAACLIPVLGLSAAEGADPPTRTALTSPAPAAGPAEASGMALQPVLSGLFVPIRRCNDCQAVRTARWIRSLSGDRARVYGEAGFPVYRYREDAFGQVVEYWTYPERHRTYVFAGNRLLRSQSF